MPLDQEDPGIESYDRTKNEKQRRLYGQGVVIEIKNGAFLGDDGGRISSGYMDDRSLTLINSAEDASHGRSD